MDWAAADHAVGTPFATYSGFLVDIHYAAQQMDDMWSRGLLWFTPGVTLTQASSAQGHPVAGSLDMAGTRNDAQYDIN